MCRMIGGSSHRSLHSRLTTAGDPVPPSGQVGGHVSPGWTSISNRLRLIQVLRDEVLSHVRIDPEVEVYADAGRLPERRDRPDNVARTPENGPTGIAEAGPPGIRPGLFVNLALWLGPVHVLFTSISRVVV